MWGREGVAPLKPHLLRLAMVENAFRSLELRRKRTPSSLTYRTQSVTNWLAWTADAVTREEWAPQFLKPDWVKEALGLVVNLAAPVLVAFSQ